MLASAKSLYVGSKLWWQARKWAAMTPAPAAQARNTNIAAGGKIYP